jgi:hypothetical protein
VTPRIGALVIERGWMRAVLESADDLTPLSILGRERDEERGLAGVFLPNDGY